MPPKNKQKGHKRKHELEGDDWISQLAKQASESSSSTTAATKEERIERRNAKKRRRQDKRMDHVQREGLTVIDKRRERLEQSHLYLDQLSEWLETCLGRLQSTDEKWPKLYQPNQQKKGKATAGNQWNEEIIQPRPSAYGGLGLARGSLYIGLRDPSFIPLLEEEFAEHIQGFFGKQRTKAMKKQLDGNMLWRQLADKRVHAKKVNGRKLGDMSPEERVDAMIEAGMV